MIAVLIFTRLIPSTRRVMQVTKGHPYTVVDPTLFSPWG